MITPEAERCVDLWVRLASRLGVFDKDGGTHRCSGEYVKAASRRDQSLKALASDIARQPGMDSWRRLARLASDQDPPQALQRIIAEGADALRSVLLSAMGSLCEDEEVSDRLWKGQALEDRALLELISSASATEEGAVLMSIAALPMWCHEAASPSPGGVCGLQNAAGIWKKKSSYKHSYGSSVYPQIQTYSCLFRSSFTLLLCVCVAIALFALGF